MKVTTIKTHTGIGRNVIFFHEKMLNGLSSTVDNAFKSNASESHFLLGNLITILTVMFLCQIQLIMNNLQHAERLQGDLQHIEKLQKVK